MVPSIEATNLPPSTHTMTRISIAIVLFVYLNSCYAKYVPLSRRPVAFLPSQDVYRNPLLIIPRGGDDTRNNTLANTTQEFDTQSVSNRLKREEIQKVRDAQQFLKKQQRRREMDQTWLDKSITATIEFFENVFRWEIIDVKK